jgi:hypothetical protein
MAFSNPESPTGMPFLVPFTDFRFAAICWLAASWGCCAADLKQSWSYASRFSSIALVLLSFSSILCVRTVVVSSTRRNKKKQVDSCVAAIGRAVRWFQQFPCNSAGACLAKRRGEVQENGRRKSVRNKCRSIESKRREKRGKVDDSERRWRPGTRLHCSSAIESHYRMRVVRL